MSESRPTPGPYEATPSESGNMIYIGDDNENVAVIPGYADHPGNQATAQFIVEAFNVRHETGRTPRQLAERVKELEEALSKIMSWFDGSDGTEQVPPSYLRVARALLAKAE